MGRFFDKKGVSNDLEASSSRPGMTKRESIHSVTTASSQECIVSHIEALEQVEPCPARSGAYLSYDELAEPGTTHWLPRLFLLAVRTCITVSSTILLVLLMHTFAAAHGSWPNNTLLLFVLLECFMAFMSLALSLKFCGSAIKHEFSPELFKNERAFAYVSLLLSAAWAGVIAIAAIRPAEGSPNVASWLCPGIYLLNNNCSAMVSAAQDKECEIIKTDKIIRWHISKPLWCGAVRCCSLSSLA